MIQNIEKCVKNEKLILKYTVSRVSRVSRVSNSIIRYDTEKNE